MRLQTARSISRNKAFAQVAAAFREALFPNKCLACGRLFHLKSYEYPPSALDRFLSPAVFEAIMAPWLCPDCRPAFFPMESPKCPICGVMFKSRVGPDHICSECHTQKIYFDHIRSAGAYDGALMSTVHALKYNQKTQLARPLGRLLFHALICYPEIGMPDMVIPVPLHAGKLKNRGFNQAALLLAQWPDLFRQHGDWMPALVPDGKILRRTRKTPTQTGLSRQARKENIRRAFSPAGKNRIQGKNLLLIDDVCTTGATVNECARTLKSGGAACVNVLTLARAS